MDPENLVGILGLFCTIIGSSWVLANRLGKLQSAIDVLGIKVARVEKLEEQHEELEKAFRLCREEHILRERRNNVIG